ncbi:MULTISPECIES: DUF5302 domain-containing protein [Streptomyces]|uniref:DUF5302 domain-containing protein n=2 Tax=Streptomyces TaxID=1883 RepID=A0ABT9L7G9_STRGD|nr:MULTISPECIES: DUF5302 domain-containing protein [Streptomyces]MDP9679594.1 hypothetical protein [Streptomyces griseoviridis]GGT00012.1 hypothetical protein GCM10010240_36810 [Streptomyces griseoviridis]GGU24174.1 hypothetical protein GCM10010259_13140 [Streptomyces daghestanicus]GHI29864.1 hypothetical protein Sdagh_15940 [Streptomyces daghestanicus]
MTDTPETPETPETEKETVDSETKRKFQEALQRKAGVSRSQQAHQDGRLKAKGTGGPKGQSRNFRRKSG